MADYQTQYQASYDQTNSIYVEPWGGRSGGSEWSYYLKGPIKELFINHGEFIDSIMFRTLDNKQGTLVDSPKFGGSGGSKRLKVVIENAPSEYLTGIRGTLGHYGGHLVVKSLCFITNAKSYGPFGTEAGGTLFSLVVKQGGAIIGFHGCAGLYLGAIGVYLQKVIPNEPDYAKKDQTSFLSRRRGGIRARVEKIINIDGEKEVFVGIEGSYSRVGFNGIAFKHGKGWPLWQ